MYRVALTFLSVVSFCFSSEQSLTHTWSDFYMYALSYLKMSSENPQAFLALLLGCVLATSATLHSTAVDCKPARLRACCQSHSTWKNGMSLCLFCLRDFLNWNKA